MMISNKKKDLLVYIEIFQRRRGLRIFSVCPGSVTSKPSPPLDSMYTIDNDIFLYS